jgi:hypothetical protein
MSYVFFFFFLTLLRKLSVKTGGTCFICFSVGCCLYLVRDGGLFIAAKGYNPQVWIFFRFQASTHCMFHFKLFYSVQYVDKLILYILLMLIKVLNGLLIRRKPMYVLISCFLEFEVLNRKSFSRNLFVAHGLSLCLSVVTLESVI